MDSRCASARISFARAIVQLDDPTSSDDHQQSSCYSRWTPEREEATLNRFFACRYGMHDTRSRGKRPCSALIVIVKSSHVVRDRSNSCPAAAMLMRSIDLNVNVDFRRLGANFRKFLKSPV